MPKKQSHLVQYEKNKSLANSDLITKPENNDWRVTIIFYSIIHLLESSYADIPMHTTTHVSRSNFLNNTPVYNTILNDYNNLEMLSRKSRYQCVSIKDKYVEDALANMKKIESFVQSL